MVALGGVIGLVAIVLVVLVPVRAVAAQSTIEVLSGKDAHAIELTPCAPSTGSAEDKASGLPCPPAKRGLLPRLAGETTLLLRLKGVDPPLNMRFVPQAAGSAELLCAKPARIYLDGNGAHPDCTFAPVKVGGKKVFPLRIGVVVPVGMPVGAIAGNLIIGLEGRDEGEPIPLSASVRPLKEISVSPESLVFDAEKTLVLSAEDPTAKITVSGPDVASFLRTAAFRPPSIVLRNSTGDTTRATIKFPDAETIAAGKHPNSATGTLSLSDPDPPPGKYTGKATISDFSGEGPTVEVELHSHWSFWKLVWLAFAGALIGAVLTHLVTLAMRRALLLKVLNENMEAYTYVRRSGETQSWHLEDLLGEDPIDQSQDPVVSVKRLQGRAALEESIKYARSSKDLDEDATRLLDLIGRIQRWLRVEPVARRLAIVARESSGKPAWTDTITWRFTQAALAAAKREPPSAKEADALVGLLLFQTEWHHRAAALWRVAPGDANLADKLTKIETGLEKVGGATWKPELLDVLFARLLALGDGHDVGEAPQEPSMPDVKPVEDVGITPVRWDASPDLFTGWATLDAPSYGQLSRRAATSARSLASINLENEARSLSLADGGWTLVAVLLASVTYGTIDYSDIWGTREDMVKAFVAGVTGVVVINWAALPLFQSIRLRASKEG